MPQLTIFTALQSSTEGLDTELKSARGGMPGSFWESYAAMANTQGGTIVLGLAEKASGGVGGRARCRAVAHGAVEPAERPAQDQRQPAARRRCAHGGRRGQAVCGGERAACLAAAAPGVCGA